MALSNIFKYISHFRHRGHQVGRKVGDMLEVLTYAALTYDGELAKRLQIEPKIYGFCDAGHKVEFAIRKVPGDLIKSGEIKDPSQIIGFIECKKVGVEQTTRQSFKKKHQDLRYVFDHGKMIEAGFKEVGSETENKLEIAFHSNKDGSMELSVSSRAKELLRKKISAGHRIIIAKTKEKIRVLSNDESLRDVKEPLLACQILEISDVRKGAATVMLNDCLPGPQTPEKAKQAGFVALDVRKLRFGKFDKRPDEKDLVSILVLTEFAHWEQKSQSVVKATLDKVVVVEDELVIEAFERFEKAFGEKFYDKISKDNFEKDPEVRKVILEMVEAKGGNIFRDLGDGEIKRLTLADGVIVLKKD